MSELVNSDTLLTEYRENRARIKDMISDLEDQVDAVKQIMPKDTKDFRRSSIMLEKTLKTITEFYKLIFDIKFMLFYFKICFP